MRLRVTVALAFTTALAFVLFPACGDDATTQPSVSAGGTAGAAGLDGGGAGGKDASGQGGTGAAGSAGFAGQTGGTSGAAGSAGSGPIVCDPAFKAERWAAMVQEPIIPPKGGAGIDLTGGPSWKGITLEEAEKINCKGKPAGENMVSWGDNDEVLFAYEATTHKGVALDFWPGYLGTLDFKSRDGAHSYRIAISAEVTRDGQPFPMDWFGAGFNAKVDELGDALMATFAPEQPPDVSSSCSSNGVCTTGSFGNVAYVYVPLLGLGVWTPDMAASDAIIDRVDILRYMTPRYATGHSMLKLDVEGPVERFPDPVLNKALGLPCEVKWGVDFGDFLLRCVRVTGNPALDQAEEDKVFSGITHDTEQFHFGTTGLRLDFSATSLAPDKVLGDTDRPKSGDLATELTLDMTLNGRVLNDRLASEASNSRDNHGFGLVYMEYARLVQAHLRKFLEGKGEPTFELGAPECLEPNVDPTTDTWPNGCTGMEGFVTCAPRSITPDPLLDKLSQGFDPALNGGAGYPACGFLLTDLQPGLKPGTVSGLFCSDPVDDPKIDKSTGTAKAGFSHCVSGNLWETSFARVLHVMGHDNLDGLPPEARDPGFFFKLYFEAFVKYMLVAGAAEESVASVHAVTLDSMGLHFDAPQGSVVTAAYVDRRFVTQASPPVELTLVADVKNGSVLSYQFSRHLYRGDFIQYAAAREAAGSAPGAEHTAELSNLFGSDVLQKGYHAVGPKSAFDCATADPPSPGSCGGQNPPLDSQGNTLKGDDGLPILSHYKAAFEGSATALSLLRDPATPRLKITHPQVAIQAADLSVPLFTSPYDPTSPVLETFTRLVGYQPKQPGTGFSFPIDAVQDKSVDSYRSMLFGRTISASLAWDWLVPDAGPGDGSMQLMAVESSDFLGDVFLCQDPASGDLLRARLFSPADELQDWIIAHAGAATACKIVIRTSQPGNIPSSMASLTHGVKLDYLQIGGKARVASVMMTVPGI